MLQVVGVQAGSTERRLFVVPAREYGAYTPKKSGAQRGSLMGIVAAGHAGGHLVNAGGGAGFFIDVFGTPNGQGVPELLVSSGLHRLETQLGITRVEQALITHLHADHAGGLSFLVR